jgi:hypothetical protein
MIEVSKGDAILPDISREVGILTMEIIDCIRNNKPEELLGRLTQEIRDSTSGKEIAGICNTIARGLANELVPHSNYYGKTNALGLFYRAGDSQEEFFVQMQGFKNKELYLLEYITQLSMVGENSAALEEEARQLHEQVESVIPGVTFGVNLVNHRAYDEIPSYSDKQCLSYTTIVEVSHEPEN